MTGTNTPGARLKAKSGFATKLFFSRFDTTPFVKLESVSVSSQTFTSSKVTLLLKTTRHLATSFLFLSSFKEADLGA